MPAAKYALNAPTDITRLLYKEDVIAFLGNNKPIKKAVLQLLFYFFYFD